MQDASPEMMSLFCAILERSSIAERAAYLDAACGSDQELRDRIDALLRAHEQAGGFLTEKAEDRDPQATTDEVPIRERPGTVIGPYKLMEQIGEGGMGLVFVAEQQQPVRRKVALKVIKPGMETRHVVARFEAERQALALMDHPNIARVIDGGQTAEGRPYFVMELVKGTPITEYCDRNQLPIRARLELFVSVCQAVQHAHQKGIIHRDLKPNNVLVMSQDGTPVVKVIDFGVAKAIGQQLTDKTICTQFTQMIGTPLYMSPEQAGQSGLDVDTRSDIYSLGVLLYELLTGTTPFDKERLRELGYDEMRRLIREEEPPRPSTRMSTLGQAECTVSTNRRSDPKQLSRLFRGELDWIVMKALEKDRNRRYESASAFAADVQRYLCDEPVLACPPSAWYRCRKFARRNRGRLSAAALLGLALMVAITALGWQTRQRAAIEQERLQRQKRLSDRVDLVIADVERLEREQKWLEALATAQRADAALASGEADDATQQRVRDVLYHLEFIARLDRIRQEVDTLRITKGLIPGNQQIVADYARAFRDYGADVEQLPVATAVDRLSARPALALPITDALYDWVTARHFPFGARDAGEKRLLAIACGLDADSLRYQLWQWLAQPVTPALQTQLRQLAQSVDVRSQHPETLRLLATNLRRASLPDAALQILRDGQQVYPGYVWLNSDLASFLSQKQDREALRYYAAAVGARPDSAAAHQALGLHLLQQKKPKEAAACFRKVTELAPTLWLGHYYLGLVLRDMLNQPAEAIVCMNKLIALDPKHGRGYLGLGMALADQNKLDEAIACYHKAIEVGWPRSDAYTRIGFALEQKGLIHEAIAAHRKAIGDRPTPVALVWLASAYGAIGQWDKAVARCEQAVKLYPQDVLNWHAVALSHVGASNIDAYRGICRQMIERFRRTDQPEMAESTASTCLLLPGAVEAADFESVRLLAERAVTRTEEEHRYRCYAGTKALADYRAGRPADAAEWIKRYFAEATKIKWAVDWDARAFAILALVERQLGRNTEAQAALRQAQTLLATKRPDFTKGRGGAPAQSFGWLYSQILCREAETVLGKKGNN